MMEYNNDRFGRTNEYEARFPQTYRLYVFTPYYIEIETETAGQQVFLTCNNIVLMRVSASNRLCRFPINGLIQSFFAGVQFGDVLQKEAHPSDQNASSKLIQKNKTINIKIEADIYDYTLTYDMLWGALQTGQSEAVQATVFVWRENTSENNRFLPLTATKKYGSSSGSEVFLSDFYKDIDGVAPFNLIGNTPPQTVFTYIPKLMPYCHGGIYIRWIDPDCDYKYYYFSLGTLNDELQGGADIKQNVWSSAPSVNGLYLSDLAMKQKKGMTVIECGVLSATYEQQTFLKGLERSIKQYMWRGFTNPETNNPGIDLGWIECRVEVSPIVIDRHKSNREIVVKVILPSLYLQKL